MNINIDTGRLDKSANEMKKISAEMDEAMSILLSVKNHNGWTCQERFLINNEIDEVHKQIRRLQERSFHFSDMLRKAADEFLQEETAISQSFAAVEDALRAILSDPVSTISINAGVAGLAAASGAVNASVWKPNPEAAEKLNEIWRTTAGVAANAARIKQAPVLVDLDSFDLTHT